MTRKKKTFIPYAPQWLALLSLVIVYQLFHLEEACLYQAYKIDPVWVLQLSGQSLESLEIQEVYIPTEDGEKLNAWYFKPKPGKETVLTFHGGGIAVALPGYQELTARGYGVLAVDPRGYGKSTGSPSEQGLYKDLVAASRYLTDKRQTPPQKQIAAGFSLGSAVVIDGATKIPFRAVFVSSAFTRMTEVTQHVKRTDMGGIFAWLPLEKIVQQPYDSLSKIKRVHSPLIMIHGDADTLVPVEMGKTLFKEAGSPCKKMIIISGANHFDVLPRGKDEILEALDEVLKSSENKKQAGV